MKTLLYNKEMLTRLKRQPIEWEKMFAGYTSDKELVTRTYGLLKKLNSPKINDPMKKWANKLKEIFQRKNSKWPKNT
jgi:hypothetical protein